MKKCIYQQPDPGPGYVGVRCELHGNIESPDNPYHKCKNTPCKDYTPVEIPEVDKSILDAREKLRAVEQKYLEMVQKHLLSIGTDEETKYRAKLMAATAKYHKLCEKYKDIDGGIEE